MFCSTIGSALTADACRHAPSCAPVGYEVQAHSARPDPTRPDPTRPDPTRPDPTRPDPVAFILFFVLSKPSGVTTEAKLLGDDNKINPDYYVDSINDFFP